MSLEFNRLRTCICNRIYVGVGLPKTSVMGLPNLRNNEDWAACIDGMIINFHNRI